MNQVRTFFEDFIKNIKQDLIKQAIEMLKEFKQKFPRSSLANMKLEDYALGKTQTGSFSWWLEYYSLPLGSIKGGSALKHVIYYSTKDNQWKYPGQFTSEGEAWTKLRQDIIDLVDAYDQLPSPGISQDNLLFNANMLKGKILYLYYPEKFIPVYKLEHIQKFLGELGVPDSEWAGKDNIECNLVLKQKLDQLSLPFPTTGPEVNNVILMRFLYSKFNQDEKFFKIAPGEDACYWDECFKGGYISIGWNEVGDLRKYADYDEFKNAFLQFNYHKSASKNTEKANEVWNFFNLKPGDKILANKGISQIIGIGTVTEKGYEYRDDLQTQKHVVYVEWDKDFKPRLIPKQAYWALKAMIEVSRKNYIEWTTADIIKETDSYTTEDEQFFTRLEKALERKGQCILYGPPGTGKTYLARKYVKWKYEKEKLFSHTDTIATARLWMMVASNKFDFKWDDILGSKGTTGFKKRNVPQNFMLAKKGDKVLCYQAGTKENGFVGLAVIDANYNIQKDELAVKGIRKFNRMIAYDDFKNLTEFKTTQAGRMGSRGTMFELHKEFIEWLVERLQEDGDKESVGILSSISNDAEVDLCTFHPSFNYEDFVEGYKPLSTDNNQVAFKLEKGIFIDLCNLAINNPDRPYFLIIDEINRGNIPKIFGELITLLEKDKRGIQLVLPQSKDVFSIPPNIFIIGTMNTSDRSIKMMDAALKRRFASIECMPILNLIDSNIDVLGFSPAFIMDKINRKLVELGGRDKQIGHAYFMKNGSQVTSIDELKDIYELDIIPLVQDYCFDDYDKLGEVVGTGFIDIENMSIRYDVFQDSDDVFISELIKHFKG